jgi:uncharacterized membrane protein YeaQ/YmgE (transglycosylase-associated protein family)
MGIIAFIVIGFIVGLIARIIIPGSQKIGLTATCLLGIVGSLAGGGILGSVFDRNGNPFELVPLDILLAVLVASLVLFLVGLANSRRAHA